MEGVLLLAYTPRQPSIGTENMLRSAYRAGFRGKALVHNKRDGWKMGGVADSELSASQDNIERSRDPTHKREGRQTVDQHQHRSTNQQYGGSLSHAGPPTMLPPQKIETPSKERRPVLLSFWLPPDATRRRLLTASTDVGNGDGVRGSEAIPSSPGRTPVSLRESVWLSEWESVFHDLRHRNCGVLDAASEPGNALACRRGGGNVDDDVVTDEYLWGRPGVENNSCEEA